MREATRTDAEAFPAAFWHRHLITDHFEAIQKHSRFSVPVAGAREPFFKRGGGQGQKSSFIMKHDK